MVCCGGMGCGRGLSGLFFFFFNDTATTEIYTLSLHDALPIRSPARLSPPASRRGSTGSPKATRSEEHTSELQSPCNLVCRLLLEKKKPNHCSYSYFASSSTAYRSCHYTPQDRSSSTSQRLPTQILPASRFVFFFF